MLRADARRCGVSIALLAALLAGGGCARDDVEDGAPVGLTLVDPSTLNPPLPPFLEDIRCKRTGQQIRCTAQVSGPIFGFVANCHVFGAFAQGTERVAITAIYDAAGNLRSVSERHDQTGEISNPMGGTTSLPFSAHFTLSADVVAIGPFGVTFGPATYTGQAINVVIPGTGVVLHDVGKIVIGQGGLIFEGGPHDLFHGDTGALCEALCSAPFAACAGACTSLQFDPANCGACGNVCGPGQVCQEATCVADPCANDDVCNPQCGPSDPDCYDLCAMPDGMCRPECGPFDPDCFPNCQPMPDGVCDPMCGPMDGDCQGCFDPMPNGSCTPGCEAFGVDPDCPCPAGTERCNGNPFCTSTQYDPANCGGCGIACATGETCGGGTCVPCVSGDGTCAPGCAQAGDTDCPCATDQVCDPACGPMDADCQACFNPMSDGACPPGCEVFNSDPDCPCPPGAPTRCAGSASCTNLDNDPANCGACGVSCVAGQACAAGQCVAAPMCGFDQACDPMCPPGADPDCGMPLPCSPGEFPCPAGMVCEPMMGVCIPG